jgi:hypothetical protein
MASLTRQAGDGWRQEAGGNESRRENDANKPSESKGKTHWHAFVRGCGRIKN